MVAIPPQVALLHRGPCIQVIFTVAPSIAGQVLGQGGTLPSPVAGLALIDTGASTTCIDDATARQMGLPVIDVVQMTSASHASIPQNIYPVQIEVIGPGINITVPAMGANLAPQGIHALIGRDFLQHCTLHYNGLSGEITLAI
jgi:predicted aspartyl protease